MRTRYLVIASITIGSVPWSGPAFAQDSQLPEVYVPLPTAIATKPQPKRNREQSAPREPGPKLVVFPTAPLSSADVAADKVPAATSVVTTNQIQQSGSPSITDSLLKYVPSIAINEVTGNPFQPDIQFRGFVASPLSGTPQGLAVYQNGVRINEAFGDTVNWDVIPTAAIKSVALVTGNPAFGLNALGGAIDIRMKDGFSYHGAEIDTMGGSFGRVQSAAQWGRQYDNVAVYGALEGVHEDGFRNFSASNIRRFYGDVGVGNAGAEVHFNMGVADNDFGAAATVPAELLQQSWGATFTTPQTSTNKVGYANLTGKFDITPTWTVEGVAHVRFFGQSTQDGNPTRTQPCADPTLLCFGDTSTPAFGLNGVQLVNFAADNPIAVFGENDRTTTRSTTSGASLQATNTDELFGHGNHFVVGTSLDTSVTHFGTSAELGTFDPSGNFVLDESGIFLGRSGSPVSDGPVSLRAANTYTGIYTLDTFDVTNAFSITGGGRFNVAQINLRDQLGTALNGGETYTRFNPVVGGTYKITPGLTAYAGYSEANRAPTPLELECANPSSPCIIATFLVSDPPLKQVVSRTVEAGFRGTQDLSIGNLSWKLGAFRAENTDDILAVPSPVLQGFGFFSNVGSTRRQGIETEVTLKSEKVQFNASYTLVDARFLDAFQLASNSPFADASGNIQVLPGNQIPAIPRHRVKAGIDYALTDAWKFGGDMLYVTNQYFVGDASNQAPKLPSYTVFNLHSSYQIDKNFQVYARLDNVFDKRYATYGTFFDTSAIPNFANGGAPFTDPRSLSPARPRAIYVGLKATF